jgi:hypothetical protein
MKRNLLIFLFLLLGTASGCAQEADIYILAGQSNMMGMAPLQGEPLAKNAAMLYNFSVGRAEWCQAKDPLSEYAGSGMGPGMSFADSMAALTGQQIGLVMCAKGGTHLAEWMPDYMTHSLYGAMIANARKAAAAGGHICGLIWYQGEAEAVDRADVLEYSQRMHVLFSAVRQDLGLPDLPIIFVQLGPGPNDYSHPYWHDIQVYQQYIADAQPPGIAMVTAADLKILSPTDYHLNQQSQIILGARIADAMYNLSFK